MSDGAMKVYGRLATVIAALVVLVILDRLFTGPLAVVFGLSEVTLAQWMIGALCLASTLKIAVDLRRAD